MLKSSILHRLEFPTAQNAREHYMQSIALRWAVIAFIVGVILGLVIGLIF